VAPFLKHAKKAGIATSEIQYYINPAAPILIFDQSSLSNFLLVASEERTENGHHLLGRVRFDQKITVEEGYDILDLFPRILQATWGHKFQPEDEFGTAPFYYQCNGSLLLFIGE